jgi:hypothetical protein
MPACAIEHEDGVSAGRDPLGDLHKMQLIRRKSRARDGDGHKSPQSESIA